MADTITMTITATAPLTARADGADTECPIAVLDNATYAAGDRVTAQLRTPQMPLITGKVTT